MELSGKCMCGKIHYRSTAPVQFTALCCCDQCQKITGSGHSAQFALLRQSVQIEGAPKRYELTADSGNKIVTMFCPDCGNPIFKTSSGFPDFLFFHAATLDDPAQFTPQRAVWTRNRRSWDYFDPVLPAQA